METLMDGLKGLVTSKLIGTAASQFGESESGVASAVNGLSATVLHGLADKTTDSSAFGDLFNALSGDKTAGFLDDLPGLLGGGNLAQGDPKDIAGGFLGQLFGGKVGDILGAVAGASGISRNSTSGLLGMVGPMIMGYLGKRIASGGLDAAGLGRLLGAEKAGIAAAVPGPVRGLIGISDQATVTGNGSATSAATGVKKSGGWLWPLIMIGAAIGVLLFLLRGCSDDTDGRAAVNTDSDYTADLNGYALRGSANGVESRLLGFIQDGTAPCDDPECWFTFDRLTFATGSSNLNMATSDTQLENIAQILKAHPDVMLKIGGYTDNTGSDEGNMTLSKSRADAVVAALALRGVAPGRLDAEGFGSQFPVATNDTEEGRARNRRIDVRLGQR